VSEAARLGALGIARVRAENPSKFTLTGTNTWVVGRDPAWVIDPGPALAEHLDAIVQEVDRRGGLGGVLLTHGHPDHREAAAPLLARRAAPLAAAHDADVPLADEVHVGPLRAVATPGHTPDHFAFIYERACFTGDAVLGEGSVFIAPDPGALDGYLRALRRLQDEEVELLCPGHGPPVWDAQAKLAEYIEHRLERERRLLAALAAGRRSADELLDDAWSDVPPQLRLAAAITLAAHLDKLADEGRLPEGVERPEVRLPTGGV
jgi:glyoxylase-like metal-dependent hydrolase (beta-lactamase superfamily II)